MNEEALTSDVGMTAMALETYAELCEEHGNLELAARARILSMKLRNETAIVEF